MLKRTISGAFFVAVIAGFLLLKEYVDSRLFSILVYFCAMIGTMELARALKDYTGKKSMWLTVIYGILFIPSYAVTEFFISPGNGIYACLILALTFLLISVIFCFIEKVLLPRLLFRF